MTVTLKNERIQLLVNSLGAEMNSLIDLESGKELLWNGNPEIWKFHAPLLFPHCGKIKDSYVVIDEKSYFLKSNGIVREKNFNLVEQTPTFVKFELFEDAETLDLFPYKFRFTVTYELKGNKVEFTSRVKNMDQESFLFSIGSHSAFMCPVNASEKISDYQIEFEKKEPLSFVQCLENGFLLKASNGECPIIVPYGEKEPGIIPLREDLFGNGHLICPGDSEWVGLRNKNDGSLIKVNCNGYPYVMLWQNAGKAAFVCLEPWYGMPDADSTDHLWENKPGLVKLLPGEKFKCDQSIELAK